MTGSLWTSCCWNCGKVVMPVWTSGLGQHEFHCEDCDVKWVTPEYWAESNIWKDEGFAGYERYRENLTSAEMKRYKLDELVDHGEPCSSSTPA